MCSRAVGFGTRISSMVDLLFIIDDRVLGSVAVLSDLAFDEVDLILRQPVTPIEFRVRPFLVEWEGRYEGVHVTGGVLGGLAKGYEEPNEPRTQICCVVRRF